MRKNDQQDATQPFGQGVGRYPAYARQAVPPRRPAPQGHGPLHGGGVQQYHDAGYGHGPPPTYSSPDQAAPGFQPPPRRPDPPRPPVQVYGVEDAFGGVQPPYGDAYGPHVGSHSSPPFRQPRSSAHGDSPDYYTDFSSDYYAENNDYYPTEQVSRGAGHGADGGNDLYGDQRPTTAYPPHAHAFDPSGGSGRNRIDQAAPAPQPWTSSKKSKTDAPSFAYGMDVSVALQRVNLGGQGPVVLFESQPTPLTPLDLPQAETDVRTLAKDLFTKSQFDTILRLLDGSQDVRVSATVGEEIPVVLLNATSYTLLARRAAASVGRRINYVYSVDAETKTELVSTTVSASASFAANQAFGQREQPVLCPRPKRDPARAMRGRDSKRNWIICSPKRLDSLVAEPLARPRREKNYFFNSRY